ncbi:hypothetical protein [Acidocella sp. KAb 2-4]|uniref:hypothetical protein n=1 Tax=Acidocella sp. KAb 2-4 TaxID=2885158 RepID=UPI001D08F9DF|nr:hypothetical protein [Acidocella sp. KAb 2-4]MCB5945822.1 hypothetical protein [Acidocella sp. KAb 2-4]
MDDNLAKDFVVLWQSELTAMAADRELRETWAATLALWAQAANAAAAYLPHDPAPRSPGAAQPARPAAADAASGPGVDEVEQLKRRVAELEQHLGELLAARGPRSGGAGDDA